jgi:hypothetical protein
VSSGFFLAVAALVPVMLGPLPAQNTAITATLCNGGTITIPVGDDAPADDSRNCHPKGCHAGSCREKTEQRGPKRTI